ncbi:LlaJI family restriction endonuclease [Clostridium felsineum]|uniref:LlaJI family restriction endonuclease n=1 Tax=Clostridium felsineum TaxID=36839 RepID=UPI00098BF456|nr:LlaJI family restriction endonuclease [Clostridium felsineum]URZ16636.1 Type-2 restriction enzyme BsuMI component YdjA [Clostridium felsineum DSM 794]
MKKIISKFVREQKRYSQNELSNIFELKSDEFDRFIRNLKAFGVLKNVKNDLKQRELSNLIDEDVEITEVESENDAYLYVFTYVGVITIGTRIIKCYPKYLLKVDKPLNEMKQVLKVLNKYKSKEQIVNLYNGNGDNKSFNLLAVILFLINDYYEYGVYNNTEDIVEINGEGEILWDKTINDGFAIINNNRPYYTELYTEKTVDDEYDFFKRLHECILTNCSRQLQESELLDLFDISPIELSEENIDDFGDREYVLYRLQSELNVQFITRKQILIKTLYAYVSNERTLEDTYGISMYGTNSFNLVWEEVCAEVFSNKLNIAIGQLDFPVELDGGYKSNTRLIDIIEKPSWIGFDDESTTFNKSAKDTLRPDLISILKNKGTTQFIIFDAKYYNIQLEKEKELRNYPGIEDVMKQYLYQLAYKNFIDNYKIDTVKNCFLMPTQGQGIVKKGIVRMQMLSNLGLQDIQIRLLPAKMMYEKYLTSKIINVKALEL